MEGDQSYTKIMKAVSDYLQKRMTCKSLLQNMKSWEIEDFEPTDDCCRVGLNYYGYITQRFTANTGQSNIILSNSLNYVTIGTNLSNLDAFSAFVFVLNPHATNKRQRFKLYGTRNTDNKFTTKKFARCGGGGSIRSDST